MAWRADWKRPPYGVLMPMRRRDNIRQCLYFAFVLIAR